MGQIKIPEAVRWFDGMRLAPPHFEQQDKRMEKLSAYLHLRSAPLDWGVLAMTLTYNGSEVVLEHLEAIMPGGQCVLLERGVDDAIKIDLALLPGPKPSAGVGMEQISLHLAEAEVRSITTRRASTGQDFPIQVYRPRLTLVHQAPPNATVDSLLPLVRVNKGMAQASADPKYTAPWLRLHGELGLRDELRKMGALLADAYANVASAGRAAQEARELIEVANHKAMLAGLGAHILELNGHDYGVLVHPYQVYQQLCRLLGMLSAADFALACPTVPSFQYRDLQGCMMPLIAAVSARCKNLTPEFAYLPFEGNPSQGFSIALAKIGGARQYYIALHQPPGASSASMEAWLRDATLGAAANMAALRRQRTGGIRATAMKPEAARPILAKPGLSLFKLEGVGLDSEGFEPDMVLCIEGPGADIGSGRLAPSEILLVGKAAVVPSPLPGPAPSPAPTAPRTA